MARYDLAKVDLGKIPAPVLVNYGKYITGDFEQPPWPEVPPKVVIAAAVTGVFISKDQNPNQPYTREEIQREAIECIRAGATSLHIHVRDKAGFATGDPVAFHETIDPIKEQFPDIVIDCPTHYGRNMEEALRFARDRACEISPVRPGPTYSADELVHMSPEATQAQAAFLEANGIKPQITVFNLGQVELAVRYLIEPGILGKPYFWILMPGLPSGGEAPNANAMVETLLLYVRRVTEVDPDSVWIVGQNGRASRYLSAAAVLLGGHIRVGLEDTLYKWPHRDDRVKSNAEEVRWAIEMCRMLGREVATPDEYRKLIGLR